jgi:glycosyltransferase involved in cell wall biosynthesis
MMALSANRPDTPLVSVLICSFNAERFIESTIRSVMRQTYRNLEILVLDNASSDGTVGILERLGGEDSRLKIYAGRENLGAYGGLNHLLEKAAGKYIAIQDHDDIWHSDKIRKQVEFLEENEQFVGCGTAIINYYEKYDTYLLRRRQTASDIAWHTSLVFRNGCERYDTSPRIANDFHFMKNTLCQRHRLIHNFSDPLVLRRIRTDGTNLSSKWINARSLGDIILGRIPLIDKLPALCRLVLPESLFDGFLLKVLLRRHVVSRASMKENEILREFMGVNPIAENRGSVSRY